MTSHAPPVSWPRFLFALLPVIALLLWTPAKGEVEWSADLESSEAFQRELALCGLSELEPEAVLRVVKPVARRLGDPDARVRERARLVLEGWAPEHPAALARCLRIEPLVDPGGVLVEYATRAGAASIPPLVDGLREHRGANRGLFADALVLLGEGAVAPVMGAFDDLDGEGKELALRVFFTLGGRAKPALTLVQREVGAAAASTRLAAVLTLGRVGRRDDRTLDLLAETLDDEDERVREAARETLVALLERRLERGDVEQRADARRRLDQVLLGADERR